MELRPRLAGDRTGREISKTLRQIVGAARIVYIHEDGVQPMTVPSKPLKELFLSALQVAPNERAEWMDRECAEDVGLREQLKLMLAAHDAPHSLLDQPAMVESGATIDQPVTHLGDTIGPYKLREVIGEGGMGTVYVAEQEKPIRRKVAIKVIKSGMDSKVVIARFEAERQALALMDHPNIAKVLDAGTTETGQPYFVMELVKGQPITNYCDENRLSADERIRLFVDVCSAIQHAHQKGIIHRDLKPSNVLVAQYDDVPVPKVIDFGVAKATTQRLTDKTIYTQMGQIVGTLEYMSPEQAVMNELDVDTRSDVYSLGVVLYELLVGETPLNREGLRMQGLDQILHAIRDSDTARPSARLSSQGQAATQTAAYRQTDVSSLRRLLQGDLDWVVMKAIEKDRKRRYDSASRLADDLRSYLQGDSVTARPPTWIYRFTKTWKRNKSTIALAAVMLIALCTVIVTQYRSNQKLNEALARLRNASYKQAVMSELIGDYEWAVAKLATAVWTNQFQVVSMR
jgi:serine/threonine-protein kinase